MKKLGDRVKLVGSQWSESESNPRWGGKYGKIGGTVIPLASGNLPVRVKWDNGEKNAYYESDLELISREEIMYE